MKAWLKSLEILVFIKAFALISSVAMAWLALKQRGIKMAEKDLLEKDLGAEMHLSLKIVDGMKARLELTYTGADGKGGIWFEEDGMAALDRIVKMLPPAMQPFAQGAEAALKLALSA